MYKKYHLQKDPHNAEDLYVHNHPAFTLTEASSQVVDLRNFCSPIENQGNIGSCTGNALVGALELLENKQGQFRTNNQFVDLSRLFVYYNERNMEGTVSQDAGAVISDGIQTLLNIGVCTEATWPYLTYQYMVKPSDQAYQEAAQRKIVAAARVSRNNGIDDIKTVLASGYPIVFGFTVFSAFESPEVARTGVLNMPQPNEQNLGGHAVLMVGYDDTQQRVIVRNSWGSQWGQNGYFTMPYEYVANRQLASDLWTITK